jgi:polyribonucleotide nucleotidyltransferase
VAQPFFSETTIAGRQLSVESGKLAEQADAAITVRYGDTMILVTVCVNPQAREGVDFLPLTIDYEERLYAAGKIPGGFIRREGRPSEDATLSARLTDRPLRPLLPKTWRREIQVIITVLSADRENDPDILSIIGSSIALGMSSVPFEGPVGACRVGYIDGQMVLNPTLPEMESSALDLVVASTSKAVVMIEAGLKEVSEDIVAEAMRFAHQSNQAIIAFQEKIVAELGKPKDAAPAAEGKPELEAAVTRIVGDRLAKAMSYPTKQLREPHLDALKRELLSELKENFSESDTMSVLDQRIKFEIRNSILTKKVRLSGRALTEVRPLACEVGIIPRVHGSALFTRGETQVLTITTLGSMREEQKLDGLGIEETKRFLHHYNFPPFSNGETKRVGTPGRREIGHGALAGRALFPIIPTEEQFPYTIRLVSEVLSSSGSTSMASACASTLSLMDAGIPIKSPVAGISLGLVTGSNGEYEVLTDIEGNEDNYGDMDFKVAGTAQGVTALQLDIKTKGVGLDMLEKALYQGKDARFHILASMRQAIAESRPELSKYAPRMYKISIDPEKIGTVIGPGGKTIRAITEETKTTIDINNDGTVVIGSADEEAARKALKMVEDLVREVKVGEIYTGKVVRLMSFGAFVEILPGKDGLVHVSELADHRVEKVEDAVKIGDEITVKVIEIDNQGRVNLSRRAVLVPDSQPRPPRDFNRGGPPRQFNGPPQAQRPPFNPHP